MIDPNVIRTAKICFVIFAGIFIFDLGVRFFYFLIEWIRQKFFKF